MGTGPVPAARSGFESIAITGVLEDCPFPLTLNSRWYLLIRADSVCRCRVQGREDSVRVFVNDTFTPATISVARVSSLQHLKRACNCSHRSTVPGPLAPAQRTRYENPWFHAAAYPKPPCTTHREPVDRLLELLQVGHHLVVLALLAQHHLVLRLVADLRHLLADRLDACTPATQHSLEARPLHRHLQYLLKSVMQPTPWT